MRAVNKMNVRKLHNSTIDERKSVGANPFLEGIILANSEIELLPLIAYDPFRLSSWRSENQDIDLFKTYLKQVVVPTKALLKGGLAIHKMLKVIHSQNYEAMRNSNREYFATGKNIVSSSIVRGVHEGIVIKGITGTGKSHLIKATLATIPQTVERLNIFGLNKIIQINWLYLDLTSSASVEALAHRIVEEIDNALRGNGELFASTFKGVRSAQAKMEAAIRLLKTYFCGIIVFDEIQESNFAIAGASNMREWILRIANVGIGIIFSGNPLGFKLQYPKKSKDKELNLDQDKKLFSTQLMRCLFSSEGFRIDPAPSVDDKDWQVFIKGINRCRLVGQAHPYNRELEVLKFSHTAGFEDFYVELHASIEQILAKSHNKTVDHELINKAANRSTKLQEMKPLISAFSQKNSIALRLCADVDHEYYQSLWINASPADKPSSKPTGPVGIVTTTLSTGDYEKSLAEDKLKAANRIARGSKKENKEINPHAAAVRNQILDGLTDIISGKTNESRNKSE